jgi:hypothetical protein
MSKAVTRRWIKQAVKETGCTCAPFALAKDAYPSCESNCYAPADVLLEDGDDNGAVMCLDHYLIHARGCK